MSVGLGRCYRWVTPGEFIPYGLCLGQQSLVAPITPVQLSTWRLGASMVAMTKSSRLIFSVILTKPVLGTTAISSGLQVKAPLWCNWS